MQVNNTAIFAAFNQFAATVNGATRILRESLIAAGISAVEDAEPHATAWAAQRHGCPLVDGKGKAKGRMVLDSSAPTYEAAKTSRRRVMEALSGAADAAKSARVEAEEIEIPAEILAAAAKLAKLCAEYEGARKLAAKAVAVAFAA